MWDDSAIDFHSHFGFRPVLIGYVWNIVTFQVECDDCNLELLPEHASRAAKHDRSIAPIEYFLPNP